MIPANTPFPVCMNKFSLRAMFRGSQGHEQLLTQKVNEGVNQTSIFSFSPSSLFSPSLFTEINECLECRQPKEETQSQRF